MDAAGRLFRQYGIDAVGVDCDHACGRPDAWRVLRAFRLEGGAGRGGRRGVAGAVGGAVGADLLGRTRRTSRWTRIVGPYLDPAHVADVERGCVLTTLGPEVARRPEARPAIAASVRAMAEDAGALPAGGGEPAALAALSTMVGAVVLARLADTAELAEEILAAAKAAVPVPVIAGAEGVLGLDPRTQSPPSRRSDDLGGCSQEIASSGQVRGPLRP